MCARIWVAGCLMAFAAGCSREPRDAVQQNERPAAEPKIVQFYAMPGIAAPGETVNFCYGVENAHAVRIEPPIQALEPVWNRCFQYAPKRTATYTLTATGADGRTVTRSIEVTLQPAARTPPARQASRPQMIQLFLASATETASGRPVTLCYGVRNATAVRIEPPVRQLEPSEKTCFIAAPTATTKYTLTATGRGGTESRSLVITVR